MCMSLATMKHLAEELCLNALLRLELKNTFVLQSHYINSIRDKMTNYFALKICNEK